MLPVRFIIGTAWRNRRVERCDEDRHLTFGSATTQTTLSVTEIAKKVESVVYIEVAFGRKGASGSGFIIPGWAHCDKLSRH